MDDLLNMLYASDMALKLMISIQFTMNVGQMIKNVVMIRANFRNQIMQSKLHFEMKMVASNGRGVLGMLN